MTRVALYARYSSDKQREASVEHQLRLCEERAVKVDWTVTQTYKDQAISGASLIRPGIQTLMRDAQGGKFDVVLAESLDRLSRYQLDIAGLYKRLRFANVSLLTLSEGVISEPYRPQGHDGSALSQDLAVWNRLAYIKNPDTGNRVSRLNDPSAWITKDVPELRIIDQELWERVKVRQAELRKQPSFHDRQRPRMLLSYLLKCGVCGGGFSKVSQAHYGCSTARNKGTCTDRLTVRQEELEGLVLSALQTRLMDPALLEEFCEEYTQHMNELRGTWNASTASAKTELARLARQRENIIQAIKDGVPASEVKVDLARIAAMHDELERLLAGSEEEPVLLHSSMSAYFREQVAKLAEVLNREENRAEAADALRSLIDRIELTPNDQGRLEIDLFGDLAGILTLAGNNKGPLDESDPSVQQVKLVAGA